MGPVNSNHFAPQGGQFYARYHALALARAAECKQLSDALPARFSEYARACEIEALSLEAVGQHFLQDAWSMGHMWQRWGSANLSDFPGASLEEKRDRAVLTALVSGFIHGARGVLQALPGWTSYDVNDAMCAPWDDVRMHESDGTVAPAVGDDYLDQLTGEQGHRFYDCATSGLLEVYNATGRVHGEAVPQAGLSSVDPTGAECFAQRATNESMVRGMGIQMKILGIQSSIPIDARFASWLIPQVARSSGKVAVSAALRNEFRLSLMRVTTVSRITAKQDPTGTALAEGGMGDFLGAHPNGAYSAPASYEEPALPWVPGSSARATWLARTFHRAHVSEWCAATDQTTLDTLKAHAADVTFTPSEKQAACEACAEIAGRHLRVGTSASWDTAHEPICALLGSSVFVYASDAMSWCCP
jgi:hypothetical protein